MSRKQNKGFTLLEILLVIAVIGILAAIVLVAINPNRQLAQARNAQRRSDINTIYKALEQYLIDKGSYPNSINTNFKEICNTGSQKSTDTLNPTTLCDNKADLRELVPTYLASIPTAPSGGIYRVGLNGNNRIGLEATNSELNQTITLNDTRWTPAQISTALWLDAADSSTITTVGGAVSQWNDKSGNGRNATQATAASRPAYTLNAMNALPVITFNGSNFMLFSGVHDANWSAALVGRSNGIGQAFFQFGAINTQGSLFNDGNYTARPASGGGATIAWPGAEDVLIAATFQATGANIWRNGVAGTSSSTTSGVAANSTSTLGALNSSVYLLNGFISELVVPNFGLSTTIRQQLEGYLAHKWGLTANLPNDHPYKNAPPNL